MNDLIDPSRLLAPRAADGRACGGCTVCCTIMPVVELRKTARQACDHATETGCAIHPERPQSCRDFLCVWLRGGVGGGDDTRPDRLGVMFDGYTLQGESTPRFVAFEAWDGALDTPEAQAVIDALSRDREVGISRRDGRWSIIA